MEDKQVLIFETAKALFAKDGFKDTSVAMIAQQAGLAVGTFYLYYKSKEKLFIDIFLEENVKLKRQCEAALEPDMQPKQAIMRMLACNAQSMQQSPIMQQWYNPKVFAKLERLYRKECGNQAVHFLYDTFLDLVGKWQEEGKIRSDIESGTIMLVFSAIINVDMHKDEIGIEHFPHLLQVMADLVMDGLVLGGGHA